MITKDLLSMEPLDQFLDNAEKFGHEVDSVVVGYADQLDMKVVKKLKERVKVYLVKIRQSQVLHDKLLKLGMADEDICHIIGDYSKPSDGRAAYGVSRNHVVIEAMLNKLDVLVFIDTDVYPEVVIKKENLQDTDIYQTRKTVIEDIYIQEVDFLGEHLKHLKQENVMVTTSDYTGYYIIPPMQFEGMQDLFFGLKKEQAYDYITHSYSHHCLATDHGSKRSGFKTHKVLGGNVAIKLKLFESMLPFFSSTYMVDEGKYLTRGEDTLLAMQVKNHDHYIFYDIDMKIFHNTYSHFPIIPDIVGDKNIKDRFFYACMGWIGRNPFLNEMHELNLESVFKIEHQYLEAGSKAISNYLDDDRFLLLPKAHELAYKHLETMNKEFEAFKSSWFDFIRRME